MNWTPFPQFKCKRNRSLVPQQTALIRHMSSFNLWYWQKGMNSLFVNKYSGRRETHTDAVRFNSIIQLLSSNWKVNRIIFNQLSLISHFPIFGNEAFVISSAQGDAEDWFNYHTCETLFPFFALHSTEKLWCFHCYCIHYAKRTIQLNSRD